MSSGSGLVVHRVSRVGRAGWAENRNRSPIFSRHVDGLYYAGASTIPGIGLPMCLISAELVLKHVRGDTGTAPVAEPGGGTVFDRAVFDR